MSGQMRKPTILVSNQAWHTPGCAATENSLKPEISDLGGRVLYYLWCESKGVDQLCSNCTADQRLCFPLCLLLVFLFGG